MNFRSFTLAFLLLPIPIVIALSYFPLAPIIPVSVIFILELILGIFFHFKAHRITKYLIGIFGVEREGNPTMRKMIKKGRDRSFSAIMWGIVIGINAFFFFSMVRGSSVYPAGLAGSTIILLISFFDYSHDAKILRQWQETENQKHIL